MTDRYIDYDEVSEYGKQFLDNLPSLVGQCDLVDFAKLGALVSNAMGDVETELQKATSDRSELRGERTGTTEASIDARDSLSRFFHFLRSLPKSTGFDFNAFFPGQTMGDLATLKPADLEAKASQVLRGFDTPKNKTAPALAAWKTEIESDRQALSDAISGKGKRSGQAFVATTALVEARKNFLHAYNRIAKPIIRGVLAHVGRENEFGLFFKDLTIHEDGHSTAPAGRSAEPAVANPGPPTATP